MFQIAELDVCNKRHVHVIYLRDADLVLVEISRVVLRGWEAVSKLVKLLFNRNRFPFHASKKQTKGG